MATKSLSFRPVEGWRSNQPQPWKIWRASTRKHSIPLRVRLAFGCFPKVLLHSGKWVRFPTLSRTWPLRGLLRARLPELSNTAWWSSMRPSTSWITGSLKKITVSPSFVNVTRGIPMKREKRGAVPLLCCPVGNRLSMSLSVRAAALLIPPPAKWSIRSPVGPMLTRKPGRPFLPLQRSAALRSWTMFVNCPLALFRKRPMQSTLTVWKPWPIRQGLNIKRRLRWSVRPVLQKPLSLK